MALYAIADLHLALSVDKPMDIFGPRWANYMDRIRDNWMAVIDADDYVLLPGDISWAIHTRELDKDFEFLHQLPGFKIMIKGNHDYWWTSMTALGRYIEQRGFSDIFFLYNNAFLYKDIVICGTRGWLLPGDPNYTLQDQKIYQRELGRFRLSLEKGSKMGGRQILVAMHYPPATLINPHSGFMDLMHQYGVQRCVYGHLHDSGKRIAITGIYENIRMDLVASEYLNFLPLKLED